MSWRGRHSRHPLDPRPRRLRQTLTTTFLSERMTLDLQSRIEALINRPAAEIKENDGTIAEFLEALNSGTIRAASPTADNQWVTNTWVKQGILLCFRLGRLIDFTSGIFPFFDKHTIPLKPLSIENGVRVVPGGSSVRTGAYLAPGVICM